MSQFIVKSPEVFIELQNTLKVFCEQTPILSFKAQELLINLRETFYVDLQETIGQISQNKEAEKVEINRAKTKTIDLIIKNSLKLIL